MNTRQLPFQQRKDPLILVKQEAKRFLIDHQAPQRPLFSNSDKISIHENMFTEPIEKIFFWIEEDYQGDGFVVYHFGDNYLFAYFCYGSCDQCSEEAGSTPIECFDNLLVSQELSMNMLEVAFSKDLQFVDPDLVEEFKKYLETQK
jgi:hypothetical protein